MSVHADGHSYDPDGRCGWCGKLVQPDVRGTHPRYCTMRPAGAAPAPLPPRPAQAVPPPDRHYDENGHCRGCGKFVQPDVRGTHPRYCTGRPQAPAGDQPRKLSLRKEPEPPAPGMRRPPPTPVAAPATSQSGMDPVERIALAASFAATRVDDDTLLRALRTGVELMGRDLAALLGPAEQARFVTSGEVPRGASTEPGLLVLTDTRVLVGWSTGVWHPRSHHDELPRDEQLRVSLRLERLSTLRGWRTHVSFTNGRTMRFSAHDTSAGYIGNWVEGIATGLLRFDPTP